MVCINFVVVVVVVWFAYLVWFFFSLVKFHSYRYGPSYFFAYVFPLYVFDPSSALNTLSRVFPFKYSFIRLPI